MTEPDSTKEKKEEPVLLSKEQIEELRKLLTEHGVKKDCPMCGNDKFLISEGFHVICLQKAAFGISIGGPSIPVIPITCRRCGFVAEFSLLTLMLSENKPKAEGGENVQPANK